MLHAIVSFAPMRVLDIYEQVLRYVVAGIMIALVAMTTYLVVGRFFGSSPTWTSELSVILLAWLTFLGAALATRLGQHIVVDTVVNKLSPRARRVVDLFGLILVVAFIVIVVVTGMPYLASTHSVKTPVLGIPGSVTAAAPVFGSLAILPFVVEILVTRIRGGVEPSAVFTPEDPTTIPGGEAV